MPKISHLLLSVLCSAVITQALAAAPQPLPRTDESLAATKLLQAMRQITDTPYVLDRAGNISSGRTELDEKNWDELASQLSALINRAAPSTIDSQLLDEFIKQFRDPYAWPRYDMLARTLAHIGPMAVTKLSEMAKASSEEIVRERVSGMLDFAIHYSDKEQLDPQLVDNLIALLDDPDLFVNVSATNSLVSLGARAERALPALERTAEAAQEKERALGSSSDIAQRVIRSGIEVIKAVSRAKKPAPRILVQ